MWLAQRLWIGLLCDGYDTPPPNAEVMRGDRPPNWIGLVIKASRATQNFGGKI